MGIESQYFFFLYNVESFAGHFFRKVGLVKLCVCGGGGGGGTGVVYVARSCSHGCGIFSIGMSHPIHVQPIISQL